MDSEATKVLSSVVTMFDVMEERVTLVESLEKRRQRFPEMEVLYLLAPTIASAQRLVDDFPADAAPAYGDVNLCFLSKVRA